MYLESIGADVGDMLWSQTNCKLVGDLDLSSSKGFHSTVSVVS